MTMSAEKKKPVASAAKAGAKETASAPPATRPPGDESPTHLGVRARTPGFRRAGRAWSDTETVVPIDAFSADDLEALASEPELSVTFIVERAGG